MGLAPLPSEPARGSNGFPDAPPARRRAVLLTMRFAWGSLLTLIGRVGGALMWAVAGVILARALPVRDLGIYVATVVVAQTLAAVAASYASATGYFVSNRRRDPAEMAAHGIFLGLITGGLVFAASVVVWRIFEEPAALVAGASLLPIISRHALAGVFLGEDRLLLYNFGIHSQPLALALLLVIWLLLPVDRTAGSALAVWLIAQYLSTLVFMPWAGGAWRWALTHGISWRLLGAIISFGGVMGAAGAISYFNYRVDQLLVTAIDGAASAGIYSRAVVLAEGLWLLSTSLAVASYATVGSASRGEAARLTARAVRHTLFIVLLGAAGIALLAPLLLELLFGARYLPAQNSLRVLCIGTALFAPQSLFSNYFTVQLGRPWIPLLVALTSTLINIAIGLILIPRVGFIGGAWATTVSYVLAAGLSTVLFLRLSSASIEDLIRPRRDDVDLYTRTAREAFRRVVRLRPPVERLP